MSKFRVTVQVDIEIDETDEQTKATAAEAIHALRQQYEGRDVQNVSSRGESPEVAIHGLVQHPPVVATGLVLGAVFRGVQSTPCGILLENLHAESEPRS
ncbi:hypothetical protein [Modestobacter sp. VKM Ac-2985]|uniref:hypothetical protein n=1 Tax=Modestobacter sp. VKM Ac-2985 TaxID=3004139 RepID=UPI0022AB8E93|nr:hypothetical protein [Modestobacter sp. VKM Ac-2985]MCZ2837124.1 hypothetical protein [Modestobacter sp. VKM Ac-2985]